MKEWRIDYSVKYADGTVEELDALVSAEDIFEAADIAKEEYLYPIREQEDVEAAVLWNVGIIGEKVF